MLLGQKLRQHTTTRALDRNHPTRAPDHNPTAGAERRKHKPRLDRTPGVGEQDCLRVLGLKEEGQTTRKPEEPEQEQRTTREPKEPEQDTTREQEPGQEPKGRKQEQKDLISPTPSQGHRRSHGRWIERASNTPYHTKRRLPHLLRYDETPPDGRTVSEGSLRTGRWPEHWEGGRWQKPQHHEPEQSR